MKDWALEATNSAFDYMRERVSDIYKKAKEGASFEKWTTALIAEAFSKNLEVRAFPEIGYAGFGIQTEWGDPSDKLADLLLTHWPSREFAICEAAIVLPGTQAKWKRKISTDYKKLSAVKSDKTTKLLMAYACSPFENVLGTESWDNWFSTIEIGERTMLPKPDFCKGFPFRGQGEWALRVWEVE